MLRSPQVLEGLSLHLRRKYDVLTAEGGSAALGLMAANRSIAVVISDMRMPRMDGAKFLAEARKLLPDTVRMLLTGQTELTAAIAAVNEGQIFRFLTKPSSPSTLLQAVEAAVEQHRLITAERVLLEQTLLGSTKTLADVLALANPAAFGRCSRIKDLVLTLAARLELTPRWQLEMAATFSQLGCVSLPDATLQHLYAGEVLSAEEQAMVSRADALTERLLGNIPRLETVRAMLAAFAKPAPAQWRAPTSEDPERRLIQRGAELLRIAVEFDTLEVQGNSAAIALDTLRGRSARYDPALIEALGAVRGGGAARHEIKELPASALRAGMVFINDVKLKTGVLLVARGYEVTQSFLERIRNHASNLQEPLRVMVKPDTATSPDG